MTSRLGTRSYGCVMGHRKKKCIPMAEKWVVFARKNLRRTFHSSRQPFLSSIWTVQPRYARSDNCPISERKVCLSEWKVCLRFFRAQSTHFPAIGNIYSLIFKLWRLAILKPVGVHRHNVPHFKGLILLNLDFEAQGRGSTFTLCHAHLKKAISLGKLQKGQFFCKGL